MLLDLNETRVRHTRTLIASHCDILKGGLAALARRTFANSPFLEAGSWTSAMAVLERNNDVDVLLITDELLGGDSRRSLQHVRTCFPRVKVIVFGRSSNRATILAAIGAGAHGYVPNATPMREIEEALCTVLADRLFVPGLVADMGGESTAVGAEHRAQSLTQRQHQVLNLLTRGASNKEIARQLSLTESTVKVHMGGLFRALGVHSRTAAVATAGGFVF